MFDIARGIRTARHKAGLTQEALAEASGVSTRAVRAWEQDARGMTLRSAIMLADALEITLDELILRD